MGTLRLLYFCLRIKLYHPDFVHTIQADFENGAKFLRARVAYTHDAVMRKCETLALSV